MVCICFSGDQTSPCIAISPIKVIDQNQIVDVTNENENTSINTNHTVRQNQENEKVRFNTERSSHNEYHEKHESSLKPL